MKKEFNFTNISEENIKNCQKAAKEILNGDVLLIHTGAGFSADSGLAV